MNKKIVARVRDEGEYIISTGKTIREIAKVFGVSKSTVHKDLSIRLLQIDTLMYQKALTILKYHLDTRHIRGGESTRQKFLEKTS